MRAVLALASVAMGAGAGALALWLAPGLAGVTRATPVSQLHPVSLRDNKQPLTRAEIARFVRWARAWRRCAERRGLVLAQPEVGRNEVVLTARAGHKIGGSEFQRTLSCGEGLGGPPRFAAFVFTRARSFHLYKPRACLLPVQESA